MTDSSFEDQSKILKITLPAGAVISFVGWEECAASVRRFIARLPSPIILQYASLLCLALPCLLIAHTDPSIRSSRPLQVFTLPYDADSCSCYLTALQSTNEAQSLLALQVVLSLLPKQFVTYASALCAQGPHSHFGVFRFLCHFWHILAQNSSINGMDSKYLSRRFTPLLVCSPCRTPLLSARSYSAAPPLQRTRRPLALWCIG